MDDSWLTTQPRPALDRRPDRSRSLSCILDPRRINDIEAHRQDYVVAVVQAEARLAEAEDASARLVSENTVDLAKAIATVDQEIAAAQEAMTSAKVLATILYRPNSRTLQAQAAYEIVRQSKDGARTLQATETSPLMPGDVLKINFNVSATSPSSATNPSSVPQSEPTLHRRRFLTRNVDRVQRLSRSGSYRGLTSTRYLIDNIDRLTNSRGATGALRGSPSAILDQ